MIKWMLAYVLFLTTMWAIFEKFWPERNRKELGGRNKLYFLLTLLGGIAVGIGTEIILTRYRQPPGLEYMPFFCLSGVASGIIAYIFLILKLRNEG